MNTLSAKNFLDQLQILRSDASQKSYEKAFATAIEDGDKFIGVRMGDVFRLAKEHAEMPLEEVEKLLDSPIHEARVGAVSIMDYIARDKKSSDALRKDVFDLYIRRHDRINTWDLVDRSAIYVVGSYLADKPRDILYQLAKSKMMAERRTAILSTAYFMMKQNDTEDVLKIAELLLRDKEDLIHKAVGWMLRVSYGVDEKKFFSFLDAHASTMPRVMLRYAIEKLDKDQRQYYLKLK
jgi:3-methyladenine DNA glycosylase AlkD